MLVWLFFYSSTCGAILVAKLLKELQWIKNFLYRHSLTNNTTQRSCLLQSCETLS